MSLPDSWVDKIFDKLGLVYGQAFLRRWDGIDLAAVKADWARELSGFQQSPRAIAYALANLPADKPPTVLEFRAIGRRCPPVEVPRLEGPKADPDRVRAEIAKLKDRAPGRRADRRDWARAILAGVERGEKRSSISVRFAREALGLDPNPAPKLSEEVQA